MTPPTDDPELLSPGPDRPLAALVDRLRPRLGQPVDAWQVAAALETDGVTDRSAREDYGYENVFDLAGEVYRRLRGRRLPWTGRPAVRAGAGRGRAMRDLSHGLLYLLPGVLLPAALAVSGRASVLLALLTASGLGWVWSAGAAWLAYRLLGRGLVHRAGAVLRIAVLLGPLLGVAAIAALDAVTGGGLRQAPLVAGLLAYQMAAIVALFYRREGRLLATMAPAVAAAGLYLGTGRPGAPTVIGIAVGSVAVANVWAVWQTIRPHRSGRLGDPVVDPEAGAPDQFGHPAAGEADSRPEPSLPGAVRPELPRLSGVLLYAALSAGYLLQASARYLSAGLDLALAAAPLLLAMGLVEWRARCFRERARLLLRRVRYPSQFRAELWRKLPAELLTVMTMVGVLALPLLVGLRQAGLLSAAAPVLVTAYVAVAGAYLLAFLLAGHGLLGRLCVAIGVAVAAHVSLVLLLPGGSRPLVDAAAFLGSALLLQAMLLATLARILGQPWRYL